MSPDQGEGACRLHQFRFQNGADAGQGRVIGALGGGEALQGKAQVVDSKVGEGHVVSFAIRPFWRWQTQGNYFLGFNALLNWNDLDAGRAPAGDSSN